MSRVLKTIITVLVAVGCIFVCLISVAVYFVKTDFLEYDISRMVEPATINAQVTYLGDSFQGKKMDGCSYYLLTIEMDNETIVGWDDYGVYYSYEPSASEAYYYVNEVYDDNRFYNQGYGYYYPAGKKAIVQRVLCIEDGCQGFDLRFGSIYDEIEHEKIYVAL